MDYFVSSTGNDSNAGTSVSQAWLTSARVATQPVYRAGDSVYYEGGSSFLTLSLNGVSGLTIRGYGSGRPTLAGGTSSAVILANCDHLTLSGLTLTSNVPNSAGTPAIVGVVSATFSGAGARASGLSILGCTITGGLCGINITASATSTAGCNNVTISGNQISGATEFGIYMQETGQGHAFKHWSAVRISDNYVHDITGDAVGGTASGNGIVVSLADNALVLEVVYGPTGWVQYGTLVDGNRVDNCGVSGQQAGGLYGENSSGVIVRNNIVSNQKSGASSIVDGINIGDNSDFWLIEGNLVYNSGAGVKLDGPSGGSGVSYHHIIRRNWLIENTTAATTGFGVASDIAGGNFETSGANQQIDVYENTILFTANTFGTAVGTHGTKWRVYNNLISCPVWIGIQYADGKLPTCYGNLYWNRNFSGGRCGFYNFNTTVWTGDLPSVQALGFEKIGPMLLGVSADPLVAADITGMPTAPRSLPSFTKFALPNGSPALGAGFRFQPCDIGAMGALGQSSNTGFRA